MKKLFIILIGLLFTVTIANAKQLWKYGTFNERAEIAKKIGLIDSISDYTGDYETNIALLEFLETGGMFGSTLPVAGSTYNLAGSGITGSATSITLQSLTLTQTAQKLADSDFSDTFYLTLEPGNKTRQEIASCTTVTQNSGGTATLSGCSRGLSPITPYTASTTLAFAHAGGSQVIFSDPPQLFNQFGSLDNFNTWTTKNTFASSSDSTTQELFFGTSTPSYIKNQAGILYYCNNGASCTVIGTGANTYSFIRPLVNPSGSEIKLATSTNEFDYDGSNNFSVRLNNSLTSNDGGLAVNTTTNFTWTGTNMFTASTTVGGKFKVDNVATTTNTWNMTGDISLGNGNVIYPVSIATSSAATSTVSGASQTMTLTSYTINPSSVGTTGKITLKAYGRIVDAGGNAMTINVIYGGTTVCVWTGDVAATAANFQITCDILFKTAASQRSVGVLRYMADQIDNDPGSASVMSHIVDSTVNSASSQTLILQAITGGAATDEIAIHMAWVEVMKH